MAAIDALLRLIVPQKADGLRIRPDAAPALLFEEEERPLSMPALPGDMVVHFVEELRGAAAGEAMASEADGDLELVHVTATGEPFVMLAERRQGRVVRATFRPGGIGKKPRAPIRSGQHPGLPGPDALGPSEVPHRVTPAPGSAAASTPAPGSVAASTPAPGSVAASTLAPGSVAASTLAPGSVAASTPAPGSVAASTSASAPGLSAAISSAPGLSAAISSAPAASLGPPPAELLRLLADARGRDASDVFLSTGRPARWRIGGVLETVDGVVPTEAGLVALLGAQLSTRTRELLRDRGGVDLAFELPQGRVGAGASSHGPSRARFRVSLFREDAGFAAAFRLIRERLPSLAELGLPPAVGRLIEHRHGLVLMTGPTGSGKSTTLAALIEQLNQTVARHVITIEDPIEFRYRPTRCLIHQREVGQHVPSFADGIRSALRSAPDVILVGEMRDPETIAAALTAAETGHLVLSTLHCGTSAMAVDRIIDGFPKARQSQVRLQLSDVLRTVLSQRLLPALGGGRVPALEILQVNHAVAALIRDGRPQQIRSQIQTGRDVGMVPLERSLADLVRAGRISSATAMATADDPSFLQGLLGL